jgi:hypothetical protein
MKVRSLLMLVVCAGVGACALGCKDTKNKGKKITPVVVKTPVAYDPMVLLEPQSQPAFRQMLKMEEFDKRFEAARGKLPAVEELEKNPGPAFGLEVEKIVSGSQAEELGLVVGDVIVGLDGKGVWTDAQFAQMRMNEVQELSVIRPGQGKARSVKLKAGPLGIVGRTYSHPELAYMRGEKRSKRWDDLVRVALATCSSDPILAEMAMSAAIRRDYPQGWTSDFVGLVVNAEQGRAREAMEFLYFMEKEPGAQERPVPYELVYRAAMADFKLPQALVALNAAEGGTPELRGHLKELIALHQGRGAVDRKMLSLEEQAMNMRHEGLIPRLEALNDETKWFIEQIEKNKRVQTAGTEVDSVSWVFGPKEGAQDVECLIRMNLVMLPPSDDEGAAKPSFSVGFFDRDNPQPATIVTGKEVGGLLGIRFVGNGTEVEVMHGDGRVILRTPVDVKLDLKQDITVKLVHLNGRDAVYVNNRQILYVPSASKALRIGTYIKSTGMNARLRSMKLTSLKSERGVLAAGE